MLNGLPFCADFMHTTWSLAEVPVERSVFTMNLLMVIFGLIAILAVIGTVQAFKERNALSVVFNLWCFSCFWRIYNCNNRFPRFPTNLYIKKT